MAVGWIEDNTYGSWQDILDSSNGEIKRGDMVLTMQRITRDDAGDFKRRYEKYNNDRGRGEKNRTHDVSISDCKVYPVNLIDRDEVWKFFYLDYPCMVIEHRENEKTTEHGTSCQIREEYRQLQGPPTFSSQIEVLKNGMGLCDYGKVTEKNALEYATWNVDYYGKNGFYCEHKSFSSEKKAYWRKVYAAEHVTTEWHYFISEIKEDSGYDWRTGSQKKKARANMEVHKGEFLNLTYLDSVRLRYAIANRKVTAWRIGRCDVDYAAALRYLNKALEYLDEREKEEKEMLLKYMDELPENWQVDLALWRKEHGYHTLTEARAKKWALERC